MEQNVASSSEKILQLVTICTLVGLWCGIFISLPLWIGPRTLPRISLLFSLPHAAEYAFLISLAIVSVWALVRRTLLPLLGVGLLTTIFCVFDVTRAQPWVYYYTLLACILAFVKLTKNNDDTIIRILQIAMAGIYFWSGVQKMNAQFFFSVGPWFIKPLTDLAPGAADLLRLGAMGAPLIEAVSGFLLLFKKTGRPASRILVALHFFILLVLTPFGYNTNPVVWPWNIAMATILFLVFNKPITSEKFKCSWVLWITILLLWLAPLGSYYGVWPLYFSGALYSGNTPTANILLPEKNTMYLTRPIINWSYDELNVPPIPSVWYYKKIFVYVCQSAAQSNRLRLEIFDHLNTDGADSLLSSSVGCADVQ